MNLHWPYMAVLFLFCSGSLYAQPAIEWEKTYGGSEIDIAQSVIQTKDSGYLLTGTTDSEDGDVRYYRGGFPANDIWVVKLNNKGVLEWEKVFGGTGDDNAYCVIQTFDGGYAIAGSTSSVDGDISNPKGWYDGWIIKINDTGTLEWEKTIGGSRFDQINSIIQTQDSNFVVAGATNSNDSDITGWHSDSSYYFDFLIAKISRSGALIWEKTLGGSGNDQAFSIIQTTDKGYAVVGYSSSDDGDVVGFHGRQTSDTTDGWVVKLDSIGGIEWQKTLGGARFDVMNSIILTNDGEYIVAGTTNSIDGDVSGFHAGGYKPNFQDSVFYPDFWILKLSAEGSIRWQNTLGGTKTDTASSIIKNSNGNYFIIGSTDSDDGDISVLHGYTDVWIVEIDSNGKLLRQKTYGGGIIENGNSISITNDKGCILAGSRKEYGYYPDFWVAKLLSEKNSADFQKIRNKIISFYPNPNNGIGKITYSIEKPSQVRIELYDAIGTLSRIVVNEFENQGVHEQPFDISEFPSGQYFYRLQSEGTSVVKGFEVIK